MIPNQWYAVIDSKELPTRKPIGVTRLGQKLVFYRDTNGNPVCLYDKCCHRGAALSFGKVIDNHVQCPFHGLEYDQKGKCVTIPANGKYKTVPERYKVNYYPAKEKNGFIWVWYGEPKDEYPEINFPDDLEEYSYGTITDHWNTHYSRAIENQLDVVHLPFVHYNTIGRGNKTLVNGPHVEVKDNRLYVWVRNEVDEGQSPLTPSEVDGTWPPMLYFYYPNTWMNRISDGTRVVAAFVPIDDEKTMMYVRLYQNSVKIPVLREIFNWISRFGNRVILRQDRRVVQTQIPKISSLTMNEVLLQGDRPIVEYRRKRKELQNMP